MSDRADPMSAAARHINGGGPLAPFFGALTDSALHELASLATSELNARAAARRATLCDHPPTPGCDSCGAPTGGFPFEESPWRSEGVDHRPGCLSVVERARRLVYHPRHSVRAWAAMVLDAEREREIAAALAAELAARPEHDCEQHARLVEDGTPGREESYYRCERCGYWLPDEQESDGA